ncbi:hypothetical protein MD588_12925 [Photobacterium sp. SDRW27]|uniref:hypothetical protein n=1 Tax=Photobacterium obscurum TaxID=2829490 RepID=UPI0022438EDC|nr:hypothetical protein [Photobacterium obscurum]MCW8329713.1 hypothetical protein [Photobacterium obscurum]
MANKKFVKICLLEGIDDSFREAENGLFYSTQGEAFINKSHISTFFIDDEESTISISLGLIRAYLRYPNKGDEFQRVKSELNTLVE